MGKNRLWVHNNDCDPLKVEQGTWKKVSYSAPPNAKALKEKVRSALVGAFKEIDPGNVTIGNKRGIATGTP